MADLLPLFLNLDGRLVLLVGGGEVAAGKLRTLLNAGARVQVVSPEVVDEIAAAPVTIERRVFEPADLDGVWLVVAAATPEANRQVADAAEVRRVFVNAVDDPRNASAFLSGVVRRDGVTVAISTHGESPALTSLLREALDAVLPRELERWTAEARRERARWKRDGVPMAERKPQLLQALNGLYDGRPAAGARPVPGGQGHVSLVGAGPGDPALLTRKAMARLRAADLVLYDALIDDRILRVARRAQRFFVGKRAGRYAMTQRTIEAVMIRAARRGRRVVRLKGGDPFVFGRGGEEMLALLQARVPFDVVPGVTSAVAAPALAGIPVTHRGVSSAFLVISGHDEEAFRSAIGGLQPQGLTVVVLMGMGRLRSIAATLLARGWEGRTPAAIVLNASGEGQEVWRGTIDELAAGSAGREDQDGPGTIVIGEVVSLTATGLVQSERAYVTGR